MNNKYTANKQPGYSLEELELKWELDKKWDKDHPIQAFFINIYEFFEIMIPYAYQTWKFEAKSAWQRVTCGYDRSAVWGHHDWHSRITAEILRDLAENKMGCPSELFDSKNKKDACHKWRETLLKMAEGFEAALAISNMEYMDIDDTKGEYTRKHKKLMKKFDDGMELYHKYYFNLWD